MTVPVAVAHDYFTQRGGAERVALAILRAFPGAPLYTALVDQDGTFPEVAAADLHVSALQRASWLRRNHRLGLPAYPLAFAALRPDADVVVTSTSGWAHGIGGDATRVAYCHTPARWLYRRSQIAPGPTERAGLTVAGPPLRWWDRRAARRADRYLANSTATAHRLAATYGIDAEVLPPPPGLGPIGPRRPVDGLAPGFVLCVARLLPYKHVDLVVAAMTAVPDAHLVIVGDGPDRVAVHAAVQRFSPGRVHLLTSAGDDELRWLYHHAAVLATAAEEDYGLTPVEAASFGVPAVARAAGGHLETIVDGSTGLLVDLPTPASFGAALRAALDGPWDRALLRRHAAEHDEESFGSRLRAIVNDLT